MSLLAEPKAASKPGMIFMRTPANLLSQSQRVPEYIRKEVADYFENKGTRSWDTADRRVMPETWKAVAGK